MKKKKTTPPALTKKIPDKYSTLPLVPAWILVPLWLISLGLPNIIYSGINFADTLHILKWTVTGVPVAVAVFVAGWRLFRYGREKLDFKVDLFALMWVLVMTYCLFQPLWVRIFSPTGYALEMVCFVTVWAFYVITVASFPEWGLKFAILAANINAAVNTVFAELQMKQMNDLKFLEGTIFEGLRKYSTIILPTPENYIGNTAQQNMFGLWLAVSILGAIYLFVFDAWKHDTKEHGRKLWIPAVFVSVAIVFIKFAVTESSMLCAIAAALCVILAFVAVFRTGSDKHAYYSLVLMLLAAWNYWGIMNSVSRSAIIALTGGTLVMIIISAWKFDRDHTLRFLPILFVIAVSFWASLYAPRSGMVIDKTVLIIKEAQDIGHRRGIWTTSAAMIHEHPEGVGIGQYKWHYIEAQRHGFDIFPYDWYQWQYTHWAHNEFLQFFCEGGYIGGILFLIMYLTWFVPALLGLFRRERHSLRITTVWALGLASLVTFCAVFTRPFHRIENMVWVTLAFALSNREFFSERMKFAFTKPSGSRSEGVSRLLGIICMASSIAGVVYIGSGIEGNYILRQALSTSNADLQLHYLNEAAKHPIVYEEAMRNTGYHYIQVGEQTNDMEALSNGFNILWEHFNHEPHSEDISRLLNFTQRYQIEPVLREIASYFKPGTYHLQRIPQKDSGGKVINALMLVGGPGKDDD